MKKIAYLLLILNIYQFSVYAESNESLREKYSYYVAPLAGYQVYGAKAGYRNDTYSLELEYNYYPTRNEEKSTDTLSIGLNNYTVEETKTVSQQQLSLNAKLYLLSSFYMGTGLGYAHQVRSDKITASLNSVSDESSSSTTFNGLSYNLYLGNQWEFEHWNIGADWIGFSGLIFSHKSKTVSPFNTYTGPNADAPTSPSNMLFLTKVYIGFSF